MAREPEPPRVRAAVRVEHEHVGECCELFEGRQQSRDLAEAQQAGDVREGDRPFPDRLVDDVEGSGVEHDDRRPHAVLADAHVEPADGPDRAGVQRRLDHARFEAPLDVDGPRRRDVERVRVVEVEGHRRAAEQRRNLRLPVYGCPCSVPDTHTRPTGSEGPISRPAVRNAPRAGRPSRIQTASRPSIQSESENR